MTTRPSSSLTKVTTSLTYATDRARTASSAEIETQAVLHHRHAAPTREPGLLKQPCNVGRVVLIWQAGDLKAVIAAFRQATQCDRNRLWPRPVVHGQLHAVRGRPGLQAPTGLRYSLATAGAATFRA